MKLTIGMIVGFVVGAVVFKNMTPAQRSKVTDAASSATERVKGSSVGQSIADNTQQVASTASERAAESIDTLGDKASDTISSTGPTSPSTGPPSI